ncbi:hypothetical protein L1049_014706 [Liquidambar formosana]|uniref:BED-type domain-containing protein n=1 Tax=Liquidambar formosana TaxID=63359 RepID=A0AAP0X201_LIQFO
MSSMGDTNNIINCELDSAPTAPTAPTGTATSENEVSPPRKKPDNSRSDIWSHYKNIVKPKAGKAGKATCCYCNKEYACGGTYGTSTIRTHITKCKKYPYNEDRKQKLLSFQSQSVGQGGDSSSNLTSWKFDQEVSRNALARMIIIDELPFKHVEREGFRYFVQTLNPKFKFVGRLTVANDCLQLYANEKIKLKEFLNNSVERVSLTTDLWTSLQNISYMCLTAHFIGKDWKLHKRILNFCVVSSHKGEAIGNAVELCLSHWGIENVSTITVDNASSNDVAVAHLEKQLNRRNGCILNGEFLHMRCCAHILNLIVKEGLNDVHDSIARIRGAVKYIRSSPARAQQFKRCVEQERIKCKGSLCLDVQTRWNSTFLMLDTAIKFQKAFERMGDQKPQFKRELVKGIPTEEDWNHARVLAKFLETFYDASVRMSGSLYVTSNSYFHEVCAIENTIADWSKSLDPCLSSMAVKMKDKFDRYWGNIDKINMMLLVAVVLDPRYKMRYVKFGYSKVYPPTKVQELTQRVRDTMTRIFEHYEVTESTLGASSTNLSQNLNGMEVDQPPISKENVKVKALHLEYAKELEEEESVHSKSELDRYLEESVEKLAPAFDVLDWWKIHCTRYRILSKVARDVLAIPVSTVASECAFSTGGRVLDQFRSSLTPKLVQCLICAQDWLHASPLPINVEENIEELEELELSGITDDIEGVD